MVGQRIQILDVGPRAGRVGAPGSMYGAIIAVTSTSQVTLDTPATSSSTAAHMYLYPHNDSNISIQGGTWINQNKNALSQVLSGHGFLIRRASGVTLAKLTVKSTGRAQQGGQYAISLADVTNVTAASLTFTNTASDGLHVQGPASGITVQNIVGTNSGDDLVAFTGVDGQSHDGSRLGDCEGDISNVTVQSVKGTSCLTHLKITSGVGAAGVQRHVTGFQASGITGTVTGTSSINIVNYAGTTSFEGSISNVTASPNGTSPIVNIGAASVSAITIDGVTWPASAKSTPDSGIVNLASPSVGTATVRNVVLKSTAKSRATGLGCGVRLLSASVGALDVSDVSCPVLAPHFDSVQFAAPGIAVNTLTIASDTSSALDGNVLHFTPASTGYSIGSAAFTDILRTTGSIWEADVDGGAVATAITVNRSTGGRAFALLRSPATMTLSNMKQPSPSGAAVRLMSPAASPVRVVVSTSTRPATLISRTASQAVSAVSPTIVVDQTLLTPLDGDIILNANQGRIQYDAATSTWVSPNSTPAPQATPNKPAATIHDAPPPRHRPAIRQHQHRPPHRRQPRRPLPRQRLPQQHLPQRPQRQQ